LIRVIAWPLRSICANRGIADQTHRQAEISKPPTISKLAIKMVTVQRDYSFTT